MILMSLDMIKEGMISARPIFTTEGTVLLDEGVTIKERYLEKLRELKIESIYVRDDLDDGSKIHDLVKSVLISDSLKLVETNMNNICFFDDNELIKIKKTITDIVEDLFDKKELLVNFAEIRATDSYTFGHCVNVAVLSIMTGINLGYDNEMLIDLAVGAILHDIGKAKIERDILNKPGKLTSVEYEKIKEHTTLGYEILNRLENISPDSKIVALSHHERYDGKGYPQNLKGEQIHEYARIVAIADVFDALTNNRVYRKKIDIREAIEYINSVSGSQFDSIFVEKTLENIALYPIGKGVILNNGFKGYVIFNKKGYVSRPVIRVLYDNFGEKIKVPYIMDLSVTEDSIKIVNVTDEIELF